jgi:hypothetical protein
MKRLAIPSGIFIILMALYLWTMAPGIFWIDSAAFTSCNEILGLPHSPSFPLYTVLGRVIHCLYPGSPAAASNFYSALTASAGGAILYLILSLLLKPINLSVKIRRLASAAGALYAFMLIPVWQSAVRAEVYSLQVLLSMILIYLFVRVAQGRSSPERIRMAIAAVFVQGLSFTNHSLLALITLPMILVLPIFLRDSIDKAKVLKYGALAIFVFSIAVSFYFYLPIRSNQNPAINSGQPKTAAATIKAVTRTGEDYLPVGPEAQIDYSARAVKLAAFVFDQTGGLIFLGLIAGLFMAIRQKLTSILILSCLIPIGLVPTIWAADFQMLNFDIVAYSGLPIIVLVILGILGLGYLAEKAAVKGRVGKFVPLIFVLMVFFQFSGNLYACDLSGTEGPDRLAGIILEEAPPGAVVLLNEDDVLLPLWYYRLALNCRADIAVISAGAIYRPSYRSELKRLYPHLRFPGEFENYKIENLGQTIKSLCELNNPDRPIMIQFGVPGIEASELHPGGFLFRYGPYENPDDNNPKYPSPALLAYIADGATDLLTREFVARTAFNYGVYFDRTGQTEAAYRLFEYAIETDSENPDYLLKLGIAFLKSGQKEKAIILLREAVNTGEGCPQAEDILKNLDKNREFGIK